MAGDIENRCAGLERGRAIVRAMVGRRQSWLPDVMFCQHLRREDLCSRFRIDGGVARMCYSL